MCSVGQRRVTGRGSVDGNGRPVPSGLSGIVVGHLGQLAIVTLDGPEYENMNVLIPDGVAGVTGLPRSVAITPAGVPLPSRKRDPDFRQRRQRR